MSDSQIQSLESPVVQNLVTVEQTISITVIVDHSKIVAGRDLKGRIEILSPIDDDIEDLTLKIYGIERVKLAQQGDQPAFDQADPFLFLTPTLQYDTHLSKGSKKVVEFQVEIPARLCPCSFTYQQSANNSNSGSGNMANIRYFARANLRTKHLISTQKDPAKQEIKSAKRHLTVLEAFVTKCHPVSSEDTKQTFLFTKGSLHVTLALQRQVYSLKEMVPVTVSIENTTSKDISHIYLYLQRTLKMKRGNNQFARLSGPVNKVMCDFVVGAGADASGEFTLPLSEKLNPSVNGSLITVQYQVCVSVGFTGNTASEMTVAVPVVLCAKEVFDSISDSMRTALQNPTEGTTTGTQKEFQVPVDAGKVNQIAETALQNNVLVRASVFYKSSELYYYDVLSSDVSPHSCLFFYLKTNNHPVNVRARHLLPPTLFHTDISSAELSPGVHTIRLNAHSTPPLSTGRWYFSVTGQAFMKGSFFDLTLTVCQSESIIATPNGDEEITEHLIENQKRLTPFTNFTTEGLNSPHAWTKLDGTPAPHKADYPLADPENWYWKSAWKASRTAQTDMEGWQYGRNWCSGWRNELSATCFVRKRHWKRVRAVKTEEIRLKEEAEEIMNMEALMKEFELLDDVSEEDEQRAFSSDQSDLYSSSNSQQNVFVHNDDLTSSATGIDLHLSSSSLGTVNDLAYYDSNSDNDNNKQRRDSSSIFEDVSLLSPINNKPLVEDNKLEAESDEHSRVVAAFVEGNQAIQQNDEHNEVMKDSKVENEHHAASSAMQEVDSAELDEIQHSFAYHSFKTVEEHEREENERKQREEAEFLRMEAERALKAETLRKQREEEQAKMQDEWTLREQAVKRQIEEDRKRLEMLLGGPLLDSPTPDGSADDLLSTVNEVNSTVDVDVSNADIGNVDVAEPEQIGESKLEEPVVQATHPAAPVDITGSSFLTIAEDEDDLDEMFALGSDSDEEEDEL